MRRNSWISRGVAVAGAVVLAGIGGTLAAWAGDPTEPRLSLEQARREVRLLDDLYKTAVVYINDVYVEDENSVAAGETARDLFAAMKAKGWHDARLVDATGQPINDANAPADAFEKDAVAKILNGETYVDQVVSDGDRRYLRRATLLPVVNDKCVLCHPHTKVGAVMGAVSYKIPIE